MLDTNVLISALIFGGQAGRLLSKLFLSEHELLVSEYDDEESEPKEKEHLQDIEIEARYTSKSWKGLSVL